MYNRNAAYDFNFQPQEQPRRRGNVVNIPSARERRQQKFKMQMSFLTSVFAVFCGVALCLSFFLFGQAKLTEVTDQAARAVKELEECRNIHAGLSVKLASVDGLSGCGILENCEDIEIVNVHKGDTVKIK